MNHSIHLKILICFVLLPLIRVWPVDNSIILRPNWAGTPLCYLFLQARSSLEKRNSILLRSLVQDGHLFPLP